MLAGSDSGLSTVDNITNDTTPTFNGTATPGITVRLHSDGTIVGTATAAGDGTWTITPSSALTNGTHEIWVTVFNGTASSSPSPSLFVTIDTVAPSASGGIFPFAASPQRTTFNFSEPMSGAFDADDLTVTNLTTSQVVPAGQLAVTHQAGNLVEVRFPGVPGGLIADGNYRVQVQSSDAAGNTMAAPYTYDFFMYYGDADRDRDVDISDFAIMAGNFNASPRNFGQGDFNYNTVVEIGDFALLASRWNTNLAPPTASDLPAAVSAVPAAKPFSTALVGNGEETGLIEDLSNAGTI
jgi:hypothetical protein